MCTTRNESEGVMSQGITQGGGNFSHSEEDDSSEDYQDGPENIEEATGETEELRRSARQKVKPKYLEDYSALALIAESFIEDVPECFSDIENRDDKEEWHCAVKEELDSLKQNDTWTLTELPPGKKAIDNKWVFRIKRDEHGNVDRYKARLVVKGCSQRKGLDYDEVYAPVARLTTFRTLLSIVNKEDLYTTQMDVKNAFLHGHLQEEIYMKQPQGFVDDPKRVCKLNKTLYGLKQAPRAWNGRFDAFIKRLGFRQSDYDKCLYIRVNGNTNTYLLLYVDDIILASNSESALRIIKVALNKEFNMKDLGELRCFLGIKIDRTKDGLILNQTTYLKNILKRFNMEDCKGSKTPMEVKPCLEVDSSECIIELKPYRELIGCFLYVMLNTRPDLSAAVNYFSRFQSNATMVHWNGVKRILRYIQDTIDISLFYKKGKSEALVGYADSDWAGATDRKSTTGYILEVFGAAVCWVTKKQSTVALSSTEAEYVALASAAQEIIWLKNMLNDFGVDCSAPITIFEDNQSCIHLLSKWEHRRLKHIDVKYNFVRDLFNER